MSIVIVEAYEAVELFCGTAWFSRCMKGCGHPTASMDILLKDNIRGDLHGGNGMDMTSPAGFAQLALHKAGVQVFQVDLSSTCELRLALATFTNIVRGRCVVMCGIVCSSFVAIGAGTHKRSPISPLGDTSTRGVAAGNLFMARTGALSFLEAMMHVLPNHLPLCPQDCAADGSGSGHGGSLDYRAARVFNIAVASQVPVDGAPYAKGESLECV